MGAAQPCARGCPRHGDELLLHAARTLALDEGADGNDYERCKRLLVEHYIRWERAEPGAGHALQEKEWRKKLEESEGTQ